MDEFGGRFLMWFKVPHPLDNVSPEKEALYGSSLLVESSHVVIAWRQATHTWRERGNITA
ncbi:hypothetical protein J6590_094352, partial [Homalodisca vitripennis]